MDSQQAAGSTHAMSDKKQQDLEGASKPAGMLDRSSGMAESEHESLKTRLWKHVDGEVDSNMVSLRRSTPSSSAPSYTRKSETERLSYHGQCTLQLELYCFMTGWVDSISFAAAFIFSGFQTCVPILIDMHVYTCTDRLNT